MVVPNGSIDILTCDYSKAKNIAIITIINLAVTKLFTHVSKHCKLLPIITTLHNYSFSQCTYKGSTTRLKSCSSLLKSCNLLLKSLKSEIFKTYRLTEFTGYFQKWSCDMPCVLF